jgi:hypothetical protein
MPVARRLAIPLFLVLAQLPSKTLPLKAPHLPPSVFTNETERYVAQLTHKILQDYQHLPSSTYLLHEEVQQEIVAKVAEAMAPAQLELAGIGEQPKVAEIVKKTRRRQTASICLKQKHETT